MQTEKVYSIEWLGRKLDFKIRPMAHQADASVMVQYGDTVVLATAVEAKTAREGIDYFPLMVDLEEKLYAAGIIKGSRWVKREGRPTDESVLSGRMIDRSIRPLFSEDSRKDVQVVLSVLSVDKENDHDIVALIAASAVLSISKIKWQGPLAGIRVGQVDGKLVFNPTYEEREKSGLDLIVAGTAEKVLMIEASANEVKEADMLEAILAGQEAIAPVVELIQKMQDELKPEVVEGEVKLLDEDEIKAEEEKKRVFDLALEWLSKNTKETLFKEEYYQTKSERKAAVGAIKKNLDKYLFDEGIGRALRGQAVKGLVESAVDTEITKAIVDEEKRVDGRKLNQIRTLLSDVALLPRTHGSSLFSRGETQVMSAITLGAPGLEQTLEGIEGTSEKRYMHHYNFAAFSVGEARPMRSAGRREIGHGALAEKALEPMLPSKEDFPYVIRIVSETMGSNGSSSMASTCASSLVLMDAGVPIKRAVAGIAIGLASTENLEQWKVLTDIQDLEDGKGGMDFKVTGSREGITAIQLDTKTLGLNKEIIEQALKQGFEARLEILDIMDSAIKEPRAELSQYAPRVESFKIDPEKIREVIGAGGKIINEIISTCGVEINIEDDGSVFVTSVDPEGGAKAVKWIKDIVREFEAGEVFAGKVVRMLDFGAFIELMPGRDGMAHVSELAPYRIGKPEDFMNVGDTVQVKIKEIDDQGRVNLTLKGLPENEHLWKEEKGKQEGGGFNSSRPSNGGSNNRGGSSRPPRR